MSDQESKLAVLESKMEMYEDISKEMLRKLDNTVERICEANTKIAEVLAKHDERIEQTLKTDELIIGMIEEFKENEEKARKVLHNRIDKVQVKIEGLSKFRWQISGVLAFVMVIIAGSNINLLPIKLPTAASSATLERAK